MQDNAKDMETGASNTESESGVTPIGVCVNCGNDCPADEWVGNDECPHCGEKQTYD